MQDQDRQYRVVTWNAVDHRVISVPAHYGDVDIRSIPSEEHVHVAGPMPYNAAVSEKYKRERAQDENENEVDHDVRFWIVDHPDGDEPSLPEPASVRGGTGPFLTPIVDEQYGGVVAWANTVEQAERIARALELVALLKKELGNVV